MDAELSPFGWKRVAASAPDEARVDSKAKATNERASKRESSGARKNSAQSVSYDNAQAIVRRPRVWERVS